MKKKFYPLLAGGLLCFLSASAQQSNSSAQQSNSSAQQSNSSAQQSNSSAQQSDTDLYELSLSELVNMSVTTASKKEEKLTDAPATMQVITSDQIKKRGYIYLKDVLRDLPGMETIENYFSEMGTLLPVRGVVGNNKIIVLLNGIRVNPAGGEEFSFRSDFNIESAKQIEVMYGPASTLYGADAISAVINVITEKATGQSSASLTLRAGSFQNREGSASFSKAFSSGIEVSSYLSFKDAKLSDLSTVHPSYWAPYGQSAQRFGIPSTPSRWDKGANGFLRLQSGNSYVQLFHRQSSRSSSEGGYLPILQFVDQAVLKDYNTSLSAGNSSELSKKVSLESTLSYNRYEMDPSSRYVTPLTDSLLFLDDFKYGLSSGIRMEEKLSVVASSKFNFTAGLMAAFTDAIPKATIPGGADTRLDMASQGGSIVYYTEKNNPDSRVEMNRVYNIKYATYAAYLEGRYAFSEKVKLVAGLRADKDTRLEAIPFSPRLSVIYNLSKNITAKYIYNRAYVAPAPYYAYNVYSIGIAILSANPDLQAERAQSHELNLLLRHKGLLLTSSFYYNSQQNLIALPDLQLPVNIVQEEVYLDLEGTQGRRLTRTANSGTTTAKGIDIFGSYQGKTYLLWASASLVDYTEKIGDHRSGLNGISSLNVRAGITYSGIKNLSFTPSLIYRSTPQNIVNPFGVSFASKASLELNAYLLYKLSKKMDLFAEGRNLLNQKIFLRGMAGPTAMEPIRFNAGLRVRL